MADVGNNAGGSRESAKGSQKGSNSRGGSQGARSSQQQGTTRGSQQGGQPENIQERVRKSLVDVRDASEKRYSRRASELKQEIEKRISEHLSMGADLTYTGSDIEKEIDDKIMEEEMKRKAGGDLEIEENLADKTDNDIKDLGPQGTMFGTIANICKNVIGSGLLSIPITLYNGRIYEGTIILVFIGVLNMLSFWALGVISEGICPTYGDLWKRILNERTRIIPDIFLFINAFISASSYMVVIGDQLSEAIVPLAEKFEPGAFSVPRIATILPVAFGLVLPLCFLKDLGPLKYPSLFGLFCTIYVFIFILGDSVDKGYFSVDIPRVNPEVARDPSLDPKTLEQTMDFAMSETNLVLAPNSALRDQVNYIWGGYDFDFLKLMDIIGIYNSAFACHYNSPRFYMELKDRTPAKYFLISAIAFSINIIIFLVFGHAGYWRWGGLMDGNVLRAFKNQSDRPLDDPHYHDSWKYAKAWVLAAWVAMALSVTTSYPLVFNGFRSAFFQILNKASCGKCEKDINKIPHWQFAVFNIAAVSVSALVGLSAVDLGVMNGIKGVTTSVSLCSIFPGIMLLIKTFKDREFSIQKGLEQGSYNADMYNVDGTLKGVDDESMPLVSALERPSVRAARTSARASAANEDPSQRLQSPLSESGDIRGNDAEFASVAGSEATARSSQVQPPGETRLSQRRSARASARGSARESQVSIPYEPSFPMYNFYISKNYKGYVFLAYAVIIVAGICALGGIVTFSINQSALECTTTRLKPWESKFSQRKGVKDEKTFKNDFGTIASPVVVVDTNGEDLGDKTANQFIGMERAWMIRLIYDDVANFGYLQAQNKNDPASYKAMMYHEIWRAYCQEKWLKDNVIDISNEDIDKSYSNDAKKQYARWVRRELRAGCGFPSQVKELPEAAPKTMTSTGWRILPGPAGTAETMQIGSGGDTTQPYGQQNEGEYTNPTPNMEKVPIEKQVEHIG